MAVDKKKYYYTKKELEAYTGDTPLRFSPHELFAQEYLTDLDAKKAAIRAGYAPSTAFQRGYQLLNRPEIQKRIKFYQGFIAEKCMVTPERIIREYMKIAFTEISDVAEIKDNCLVVKNLEDVPPEHRGAIAEISEVVSPRGGKRIKVKMYDKLKALNDLGKHLGMFRDDSLHIHAADDTEFVVNFVPSKAKQLEESDRLDQRIEKIVEGSVG